MIARVLVPRAQRHSNLESGPQGACLVQCRSGIFLSAIELPLMRMKLGHCTTFSLGTALPQHFSIKNVCLTVKIGKKNSAKVL